MNQPLNFGATGLPNASIPSATAPAAGLNVTLADYLRDLYRPNAAGWVRIWHKDTRQNAWFRANDFEAIRQHLEQNAPRADVYLSWNRYRDSSSGRAELVLGTPGIFLDVDLRSTEGAHAEEALPETWEDVEAFLEEAGIPRPTAVIDSGHGTYLQYRLPQPLDFASEADREYFADLARRFTEAFIAAALKLRGWKFDNVADLPRITRAPGTLNHKTAAVKPVRLIEHDPGRSFTLAGLEKISDDLERRFKPAVPATPARAKKASTKPTTDNAEGPQPQLESIRRGCAWFAGLEARAERLPEPESYAAASIYGRCEGGREAFHELSAADSRYQWGETEQKVEHAVSSAGPRTCANIAAEFSGPLCAECALYGLIRSPIQLGHHDPDVAGLLGRTVYEGDSIRFFDLKAGYFRIEKQMNNDFAHLVEGGTMSRTLLGLHRLRKVNRAEYLPGVRERFVRIDAHSDAVNLWRPGGVAPEPGDPSLLLEHFAYLLPDEVERNHVLNVLASQVQNPGRKIRHGLILNSKQGTGKSFLRYLLGDMFGEANVRMVAGNDLLSEWTAGLCNVQILVVEELMGADRLEAANRIKTLLTEESDLVNEKHVKKFYARTPRLVLALTNHDMPIRMEESDRRWFMSSLEADPRSKAYYKRLWEEGRAEAGRFVRWLGERDLSTFSPDEPPPVTAAKQQVVDWSRPSVTQVVRQLVEEEAYPFGSDLFLRVDVERVLEGRLGRSGRASQRELDEAFSSIGAKWIKQTRVSGRKVRVWALRDHDRWTAASPAEIAAELRRGGYFIA